MNKYFQFFKSVLFLSVLLFGGCYHVCTEIESELLVSESAILRDGESWETITDRELRSFTVNRPVRVRVVEGTSVEVTSFLSEEIADVSVWVESDLYPEPLRVLKLQRLKPLVQNVYLLPMIHSDGYLEGRSGKRHFIGKRALFHDNELRFSVTSDDPLYRQITSLDVDWLIYFGNYDEPGKWPRINALYAREWIILMTNFAAVASSEELEVLLTGYYRQSNGKDAEFHRDDGSYFSSKQEYVDLLESIRRKPSFKLGVTSMGGGLGGGEVLGIDTWNFYSHYYGGSSILVHEFGHTLGYGHSSSFCYGEYEGYMAQIWAMLIRLEKLPYLSDELNGFYRPENAQYRYNSVDQNMRKPRPNGQFNPPEQLLLNNPSVLPKTAAALEKFR